MSYLNQQLRYSLLPLVTALILFLSIFIVVPNKASAQPLENEEATLNQLNQKITSLENHLRDTREKREDLLQQLKQAEAKINTVIRQLKNTRLELADEQKNLLELTQAADRQQAKLQIQQQLLKKQLQTAYKIGQHHYLKLVLSQHNPYHLSRILTYYGYLTQARATLVKEINATLENLLLNKQQILHQTQQLQALLQQEEREQQWLHSNQDQHRHLINHLNNQIKSKDETLTQLHKNKKLLEDLIHEIERNNINIPGNTPNYPATPSFAATKGHLAWPTKGKILDLFGKTMNDNPLIYNGVIIHTQAGKPVQAIYPGQVVFAHWLKGFGLLIIIDHGEGYMSLYAYNQTLHKKQGDHVNSGELIATVGENTLTKQTGLYFEIRQYKNSLNPLEWCS